MKTAFFYIILRGLNMLVKQIEFEAETIQTLRTIKKIMTSEWLSHREKIDQLIKDVKSNSLSTSAVKIYSH